MDLADHDQESSRIQYMLTIIIKFTLSSSCELGTCRAILVLQYILIVNKADARSNGACCSSVWVCGSQQITAPNINIFKVKTRREPYAKPRDRSNKVQTVNQIQSKCG